MEGFHMKVLKISDEIEISHQLPHITSNYVDGLLKQGIFNDYIFERVFWKIHLQVDSMTDYLYRLMWEQLYLKMTDKNSSYNNAGEILILRLSLSEAYQFIQRATPPILHNQIPESTKSLKDIRDLLVTFLTEDNGGMLITYLSYFKQMTHLESFETTWVDDTKKIDIINKKAGNVDIVCCIRYADCAIDKLVYNYDPNKRIHMNVIFKINSDIGLRRFIYHAYHHNLFEIIINNIKINNKTRSIYISAYISGFMTEELHNWIYDSYKVIIKKQ